MPAQIETLPTLRHGRNAVGEEGRVTEPVVDDAFERDVRAALASSETLLRQTLGFKGVTITDSLTAPAADRIPHTATRAMLAGSDLLIFGAESASERGYSTLLADEAGSERLQNRLTVAASRIRAPVRAAAAK